MMTEKCIISCDVILRHLVQVKPRFWMIMIDDHDRRTRQLCTKQQAKCDVPHNSASGNTVNFYELLFLYVTGECGVSVLPLFS
jgi:hypothetical protein